MNFERIKVDVPYWIKKVNEDTESLDKLRASLQKLVGDWVEENHKVSFYNVVNVRGVNLAGC